VTLLHRLWRRIQAGLGWRVLGDARRDWLPLFALRARALWGQVQGWVLGLVASVHGLIVAQANSPQKLARARTLARQALALFQESASEREPLEAGKRPIVLPRRMALVSTQFVLALLFVGVIWNQWPRPSTSQAAQPADHPALVVLDAQPTPAALARRLGSGSNRPAGVNAPAPPSAPPAQQPPKRLAPILDLGDGQATTVPLWVETDQAKPDPLPENPAAQAIAAAIRAKLAEQQALEQQASEPQVSETSRALIGAETQDAGEPDTGPSAASAEHPAPKSDPPAVARILELQGGQEEVSQSVGAPSRIEVAPPLPTPTPTPSPTTEPTPAPPRQPGPLWVTFPPPAPGEQEHYWLENPFPAGYNQVASPNYQYGSTAGGRYRPHHGLDLSNPLGTPILAVAEGEVVHAGPDNPALLGPYTNFYGLAVVVRLNRRLSTPEGEQDVYVLYGHMSEVRVTVGQQVKPGDVVGLVGMTGIAIGPHLHLEVRIGQNSYWQTVNPTLWMKPGGNRGTVAVRFLSADGRSWSGARLSLLRYTEDGARWIRAVDIYQDAENLGPDPIWGENGALGHLPPGNYYITGKINGEKVGQNLTVHPGQTTLVELRTQQ